jgi:hypothetical protein
MRLRPSLLSAASALAVAATATAQQSIGSWSYDNAATKLNLTGVFDPPPPTGYQPVRVEAVNGTTAKRLWALNFASNVGDARTDSTFTVAVEPGKASTSTLLVPLCSPHSHGGGGSFWGFNSHNLNVHATSPQVGLKSASGYHQRAQGFPAVAISDQLARNSLTQLNDEVRKLSGRGYGNEVAASRFVPSMLPEDWLGFSGFDYILITDDEWLQLTPGARNAILQWARFAGEAHIYRANDSVSLASLGVPGATSPSLTTLPHGLGAISLRTWNNDTLDAPMVVTGLKSGRDLASHLASAYVTPPPWSLQSDLGDRSFAGWQVILFLLVFGVLIGPVNLFVLAPVGRRHKLFFTTPVIAAGASLLLVALILLQDGTGGTGRRFVAVHLAPTDAVATVTQEQISRTGVLLRSSFDLPPSTLAHQVVLGSSPWTRLHRGRNSQPMKVRIDGTRLGGNWFQSRTLQAQLLRSSVATRGRIELVPTSSPDSPPTIASSLAADLTSFVYIDAAGVEWKAPSTVSHGSRVTLEKAAAAEILRDRLDRASAPLRDWITPALRRPSSFVATADSAPDLTIDTLPSISWKNDTVVVFGDLAPAP